MSVPWEVRLTRHEDDLNDDGHDAIENLVTVETDTTLVAAPDGAGGVEFRAETGGSGSLPWFDVTASTYGATGDGTTDDTAAVNLAIAALNTATRGVLYFPAGTYKTTAALTAITAAAVIRGDGAASYDYATWATSIVSTSSSAVMFTISGKWARFEHLGLLSNSGGAPTAGTAVLVDSSYLEQRCDFEDLHVRGFYDGLDIKVGGQWAITSTIISAPVRYGVRVRNTVNPDAGDWTMSDSWFSSDTYNATSAIRVESSGGGKIVGCKVNMGLDSHHFTTGIDVAIASSSNTSVFVVSGCSVENVTGDAVSIVTTGTGLFGLVAIDGLQVALYTNNTGRAVKLSAATNGVFNTAGSIAGVTIDSSVFHTDGTARAAVSLTNTDNVVLGDFAISGFNARYTSSGDTNTTDSSSVSYATPAIVLGSSAAAGAASTVIRSDSTIAAFDATAPTTSAIGDSAATGSAAKAARRDHVHGREALSTATPLVESGAGAVGTGIKSSREDHVHPATSSSVVANAHAHVVSEAHLSNGSATTYTLDQAFENGSVIAWNTTTLARLGVTETQPDQATVSAAGSSGDTIMFDYSATVV